MPSSGTPTRAPRRREGATAGPRRADPRPPRRGPARARGAAPGATGGGAGTAAVGRAIRGRRTEGRGSRGRPAAPARCARVGRSPGTPRPRPAAAARKHERDQARRGSGRRDMRRPSSSLDIRRLPTSGTAAAEAGRPTRDDRRLPRSEATPRARSTTAALTRSMTKSPDHERGARARAAPPGEQRGASAASATRRGRRSPARTRTRNPPPGRRPPGPAGAGRAPQDPVVHDRADAVASGSAAKPSQARPEDGQRRGSTPMPTSEAVIGRRMSPRAWNAAAATLMPA